MGNMSYLGSHPGIFILALNPTTVLFHVSTLQVAILSIVFLVWS